MRKPCMGPPVFARPSVDQPIRNRWPWLCRIHFSTNLECGAAFRGLEHGHIEHEGSRLLQIVDLDVPNFAGNLNPARVAAIAGDTHQSADRIRVAKVMPSHTLIDDGNVRRSCAIARRENAPAQHRSFHRCKVGRTHWLNVYRCQVLTLSRNRTQNPYAGVAYVRAHRFMYRQGYRANAGKRFNTVEQPFVERNDLFVTDDRRVHRKQQYVILVEPRIEVPEISKSARQESGTNHQHEGDGHLNHDQRLSESVPVAHTRRG